MAASMVEEAMVEDGDVFDTEKKEEKVVRVTVFQRNFCSDTSVKTILGEPEASVEHKIVAWPSQEMPDSVAIYSKESRSKQYDYHPGYTRKVAGGKRKNGTGQRKDC